MKKLRPLHVVAAIGVVTAIVGCEVVVSRTGLQCSTTQDCVNRGPDFALTRCSSEGTCEAVTLPEGGILSSRGCVSTLDCKSRASGPARCIAGACFSLIPADRSCETVGPVEADDSLLFGGIVPKQGKAGAEYATASLAIQSAVGEWNARATASASRPVAAVVCDESVPTSYVHLNSLSPLFVVGPFTNPTVRGLFTSLPELPAFSPTADDLILTNTIDARRRLVSCSPNLSTRVKPFQRAIELLADRLTQERSTPSRVYVLATDEEADAAFVTRVEEGLLLDGVAATTSPRYSKFATTFDPLAASGGTIIALAQTIAREKVDLVVVSSRFIASDLVTALEARWPVVNGAAPRPYVLIADSARTVEDAIQKTQIEKGRLFAMGWVSSAVQRENALILEANLLRASTGVGQNAGGEFRLSADAARTNDCTYMALYSAFAAASLGSTTMASLNREALFAAVGSATSGSEQNSVRLIPEEIPRALGLLSSSPPTKTFLRGAAVDLGLSASFTPTGTPSLECIGSSAAPRPGVWTPSGVTFDAEGAVSGTLSCL